MLTGIPISHATNNLVEAVTEKCCVVARQLKGCKEEIEVAWVKAVPVTAGAL